MPSYRTKHTPKQYDENHPFDVVICFDTTPSMKPFIEQVKSSVKEMVTKILDDIPNVQIAVSTYALGTASPNPCG